MIRDRLSPGGARPTLLRLHEISGGNPFYALELARALRVDGHHSGPTQPLPVPERLEELVSARLEGFTGATHEALVLASAQARLTAAELGEAGLEESALDPALREKVIELEHGAVRFAHPLLASVLYRDWPRTSGNTRTAASPSSSRIRSFALVTWHARSSNRTPGSPRRSRRRRTLADVQGAPSGRPSSPSTRCG